MAKKKREKSVVNAIVEAIEVAPKNMDSFYSWDGDTLIFNILGTPSAKHDAIGKPKGNQLKVSVRESPVRGRATDYMVHFLADEFGVSSKDIQVVMGRFNVNKQLRIKNPQNLPAGIIREVDASTNDDKIAKKKNFKTYK